jgi:hypothetical protein
VACISRTGPEHRYGQAFLKAGGTRTRKGYFGDGRVYVLNNTVFIQSGNSEPQVRGGIGDGDRVLCNYVTRNNIFQVPAAAGGAAAKNLPFSISDRLGSSTNDFDHDLYNGRLAAIAGSESHGIVGVPVYAAGAGLDRRTLTGKFSLQAKSPGHDQGRVIPNFTDGYNGSAPDMGAHEDGTPPLEFGVNAYLTPEPAGKK